MVIISKTALSLVSRSHPNVAVALNDWYEIVKNADWSTLADVKQTFNSVDSIGDNRYVFNIKGNHYRLVAMIFFSVRTVYIKFIGTHSEYDKVDVTTVDLRDL